MRHDRPVRLQRAGQAPAVRALGDARRRRLRPGDVAPGGIGGEVRAEVVGDAGVGEGEGAGLGGWGVEGDGFGGGEGEGGEEEG